jgi:2-keto-4-pentenoate hydratase/2-oxohepta-3-ene-1,7-dioic acid hydratase in catechol pathway
MLLSPNTPKVLCIAKNYFEHAVEMGASDVPPHPVIFQKPLTSIIYEGEKIRIPDSVEVHHELELACQISKRGRDIPAASAYEYISHYCLALDLTGRNIQAEAKKNSWPWDISKGFDTFLPLSSFLDKDQLGDPYRLTLELKINGNPRQRGLVGSMHYKIHDIIEYVSRVMTLNPGDLILTGTPAGVGPIRSGDVLECNLTDGETSVLKSRFEVE